MKFIISNNLFVYQLLLFITLTIIGTITYPSQLAHVAFVLATMGVFFILQTLISNKGKNIKFVTSGIIALILFVVTVIVIIKLF